MSHSEQMIENQFIQILSEKENQWTYRPDLKSEEALWQNFRGHLNRINLAVLEEQLLTDKEFKQVKVEFSRLTGTPFLASQWLRGENGVAQVLLEREDGKKVTLEAFRNKDISGGTSSYEVVHQVVPDASRVDRGDVSLLINELPIIHIELKKEALVAEIRAELDSGLQVASDEKMIGIGFGENKSEIITEEWLKEHRALIAEIPSKEQRESYSNRFDSVEDYFLKVK
jgi:type I site-specific restriction-modification system R (restriction) subunit